MTTPKNIDSEPTLEEQLADAQRINGKLLSDIATRDTRLAWYRQRDRERDDAWNKQAARIRELEGAVTFYKDAFYDKRAREHDDALDKQAARELERDATEKRLARLNEQVALVETRLASAVARKEAAIETVHKIATLTYDFRESLRKIVEEEL